jgi:hypothetical protein
MMDKILQQIVWKLTSDDGENFLFLTDIIKGGERKICPTAQTKQKRATIGC